MDVVFFGNKVLNYDVILYGDWCPCRGEEIHKHRPRGGHTKETKTLHVSVETETEAMCLQAKKCQGLECHQMQANPLGVSWGKLVL